ncbi:MAG: NAD kinase [Bacteroidales bacterium]|nr:NAD kinase [Bacteroidales bacterium]
MKVALYGNVFNGSFHPVMKTFLKKLFDAEVEVWTINPFFNLIKNSLPEFANRVLVFNGHDDFPVDVDFLFSIGGDGTFLESAALIRGRDVPIVGINIGRLGFLAYISEDNLEQSIDDIFEGKYTIEDRTVIEMKTTGSLLNEFALNEIAIQKKDSKLITIHAYLNGDLLNSYWADGLIIATPTGSTAYSLSVGGPIVAPGSMNFIISPISPHTLAVRPLIIPDFHEIRLEIESRTPKYLVSADYRSYFLETSEKIVLRKADTSVKMIKLKGHSFYNTIRAKLLWGIDIRN